MLVAAVQLTSTANSKKNLAVAKTLMSTAVRRGAEVIALPEYFSLVGTRSEMRKESCGFGEGVAFNTIREFAAKHGVCVLAGSIPTIPEKAGKGEKRLVNRSILFGPTGKIIAYYDKIHLFDAELPGANSYRESEAFRPGSKITVAETPFGRAGFTVCYDLRFPELFRTLALRGARLIFVPSAFAKYTGKDHWLPLLKARAIENQVYIVAPAQYGSHSARKTSYGKSCIIDPWGNVVALAPDREAVIVAELDFKYLTKVRKELPALKHYRKDLFSF